MNNQFSVFVKRYLVAALIALLGIIFIAVGVTTDQDSLFMIAAVNLLIGGFLAILFSVGVLSRTVVLVIGSVCIIATVFIGFMSYESVTDTIQFREDREVSEQLVIYDLTQIRSIQRAYEGKYDKYAPDFDELNRFFNNDSIEEIISLGAVPSRALSPEERKALYDDNRALDDNMTEREAAQLSQLGNPTNSEDLDGFKRDTVMTLYKESYLGSRSNRKARENAGYKEFSFDRLRMIPMTEPAEEWTIDTRENVKYLEDTISTIHVYGKEPVPQFEGGARKEIGFGDLTTNSDKGTWE